MTSMPEGMPLTSRALAAAGVYPSLAGRYVQSGWLVRIGRGVYQRAGEPLRLHAALNVLQSMALGVHVGGKTALDWHGIRQYVSARPVLLLYGWDALRLPRWFTTNFPATYRRSRLFDEQPDAMIGVAPLRAEHDGAMTSEPERAFLEMLNEVGVRQSLSEARELTESTYTFRHEELIRLLIACRSVKTVRLALTLGREFDQPWRAKLDPTTLPAGSKSRWVTRSRDGLIVLKR